MYDLSGHGPDGVAVAKDRAVIAGIDVSNNVFVNSNDGTIERIDVNNGNAVSIVAMGGSRGDFVTVGWDDCLYATQGDKIVQLAPCFFQPPTPLCAPVPTTGCQGAATQRGSLVVRKGRLATRNAFGWSWTSTTPVDASDFGTPLKSTDYVLCLYDNAGLEMTAQASTNRSCRTKLCWKALGTKGFKYKDKSGTPDGLRALRLRAGAAGRAQIAVKGKGPNLSLPSLPFASPVRVQLKRRDTGECWDATYTHAALNGANGFKAKSE